MSSEILVLISLSILSLSTLIKLFNCSSSRFARLASLSIVNSRSSLTFSICFSADSILLLSVVSLAVALSTSSVILLFNLASSFSERLYSASILELKELSASSARLISLSILVYKAASSALALSASSLISSFKDSSASLALSSSASRLLIILFSTVDPP